MGTVRDTNTHALLAGVSIEATGPEVSHNTISDAKGEFRFENLSVGSYRLKAIWERSAAALPKSHSASQESPNM